jgi:hypothetical protein
MPISLVNENMEFAQKKNTLIESKFHFPKSILSTNNEKNEIRQMSMDEIINGSVFLFNHLNKNERIFYLE